MAKMSEDSLEPYHAAYRGWKKRVTESHATARECKRARSAKAAEDHRSSGDYASISDENDTEVAQAEIQANLSKEPAVLSDEDQALAEYDNNPWYDSDHDASSHIDEVEDEASTIHEDDMNLPREEEDVSESESSYYREDEGEAPSTEHPEAQNEAMADDTEHVPESESSYYIDEEDAGPEHHEMQNEVAADDTEHRNKRKPSAKAMGEVRIHEDGRMEWQHPNSKQWYPAVRHTDIREYLITEAAKLGKYQYPMARGKQELDVTSFHPAFKDYGDKRENWPKILFQYLPRLSDLSHVKPEYWQLHDGRYVIDLNNNAMYDYPHMPATLATKADTWLLLTLMRMNNTISIQDLRGRMIGGMDSSRTDPMGRNRISMNLQRFRKFACCLTWNSIQQLNVQRDYLDKKLPRRCFRDNSTESFRMLYAHEAAELELIDAGKFLHRSRAKVRDLSEAKSKAVYARKLKEYETQKEKFAFKHREGVPNLYDPEDEEFQAQLENQDFEERFKPEKQKDRVYILPDREDPSDSPSGNKPTEPTNEELACPRGHRNYAGFLTMAPNTTQKAQLLYDLLRPTREHFRYCIGFSPTKTEGDECYLCQHRDIQDEINDLHGYTQLENVPKLIRILYLDHKMLYWDSVWDDTSFGPRVRLGKGVLGRKQTDGQMTWC